MRGLDPRNNNVLLMPDGSFVPVAKKNKSVKATYRNKVRKLTEANSPQLEDIELRCLDSFHVDHKISIDYGFKNDIPAEHIAHLSNLRMLSKKENFDKGVQILVDDTNRWIIT